MYRSRLRRLRALSLALLAAIAFTGCSGSAQKEASSVQPGDAPATVSVGSAPSTEAAPMRSYDASMGGGADMAEAAPPPAADEEIARYDDADGEASVGQHAPHRERKSSPGLGTSYGEQRHSSVREVAFARADMHHPDVMLSMRYNDADGVAAMTHMRTGSPYAPAASHAHGELRMTLLDEYGRTLQGVDISGETYAIGQTGQRYAIGIENHTGERYEVVASVDGLDVVDGQDAHVGKRGYIVDPFTSFVIEGWRTSGNSVAAFRFSDIEQSYGAKTGRARNIGVIGAAFFRERGRPTWEELHRRSTANPFPGRYAPPPPGY